MDLVHKITALRSRPPAELLGAANQQLPAWASALLVVAIAWYLTQLAWALVPAGDEFDWTVRPAQPAGPGSSTAGATDINFDAIAGAHLFGKAGAEPLPVESAADAPETRLNLKLRGTVAAADPEFAHAIISDGGKAGDKVYFIGDQLTGGATLHEVHPDKIVLKRAGALETLKLPKLSETLGKQAATPQRPTARTTSSAANQQDLNAALGDSGPASIMDIFRPQPYMPNGELRGYRIYPGRDRRKFASLGLRPGDLVTAINGQQLNNLQGGMSIFKSLGSASELSLSIERSGSPVQVNISTSDLAAAARDE